MVRKVVIPFLCGLFAALVACSQPGSIRSKRELGAPALYAGLEATRVVLGKQGLSLDMRNAKPDSRGRVQTDVIDLGGSGALVDEAVVSDLRVTLEGSAIVPYIRSGETYFQTPGTWSEWAPARDVIQPRGRYVQLRLDLAATDPKSPPVVRALTLSYEVRNTRPKGVVTIVSGGAQRIVPSTIAFGYERPDQPDLVWLRKKFRLDEVIAGKKTEFEQLRALMRWVVTRPNKRPGPWDAKHESYPWNVRRVLTEENGGTIYGHCMSYCEVMISAAAAFGWQGRHWAIQGIRDTSHEVPEIWINELGKWVFFDPSLDTYYADPETREPLNLLEMHNLYLKTVLKPGEVQKRGRHVNEDRLKALRGKHPILCITGDYGYGKPMKWDWEWEHGYMTAGWMQLTPRNNWHSQPEPPFNYFGWGPEGYSGFPLYIDRQTPMPTEEASLWYTRARDFWWTLNQASFQLVRTGASTVAVDCGNSQPFFRRYLARVDGGEWKPSGARFNWTLRPGENRLEVVSEDEYGKRGISSAVVLRYEP